MTEDLPHGESDLSDDPNDVEEVTEPPPGDEADSTDAGLRDMDLPRTDDVLRKFAALGAQKAFQIDPALLKKFNIPKIDIASMWNEQGFDASSIVSDAVLRSLKIPPIALQNVPFPDSFWASIDLTTRLLRNSISIDELYSPAQLALAGSERQAQQPRASRTPEAFFGEHEVEIDGVQALLKALGAVQTKHHQHRPVWRGHQDAKFEVHSSLYRKLQHTGSAVEDRLVTAEIEALKLAKDWGMRTRRPLEFFAKLQHNGAPTRLLDATVDPEIATWFAVEADPVMDEVDGLVLGWGRVPRTSPRV